MSARNLGAGVLLTLLTATSAATARAPRVCGEPSRPCPGFKPHDLPFALPNAGPDGGVARAELRSAPFYAVLLRTAERCRIDEAERVAAQALFPRNKVFATRFECDDDLENDVTYTGVNAKVGFLALYAGDDRATAKKVLAAVEAGGHFPGANLRQMRVVLVSH